MHLIPIRKEPHDPRLSALTSDRLRKDSKVVGIPLGGVICLHTPHSTPYPRVDRTIDEQRLRTFRLLEIKTES